MSGQIGIQEGLIERRQQMPCADHDGRLKLIERSHEDARRTMEGVSTKLDLILAQLTKVALLEEKHANSTADINRAHLYINNLQADVKVLSREVRDFISQAKGMSRLAWALWTLLSGGVGAMLIKVLFFMPSFPAVAAQVAK